VLEETRLLTPEAEGSVAEVLGQQSFYSIADATVLQGYPSENLGATVDMWAGYDEYLSPDGQICRSLVKFDISSLPPGQEITEATLRLYLVSSWDFPDTSRTIQTYRATSGWSEASVTWNNKPGYGGSYGSSSIVHGAWGWYEFDIKDLVSAWYDGTYTNHGIMVRGPEVSGYDASWRGFGTRESDYAPELVVDYSSSNPPDIEVTPASFEVTLQTGQSAQRTMTIANAGEETLTYSVGDVETTTSTSRRAESKLTGESSAETIEEESIADVQESTPEAVTQEEQQSLLHPQQSDTLGSRTAASDLPIVKSFPSPTSAPRGLAYDGTYLYVAQASSDDYIYKVDPDTGTVIDTYSWTLSGFPIGLAWDGANFYVSDDTSGLVYVVDTGFNLVRQFSAPETWQRDMAYNGTSLLEATAYTDRIWTLDTDDGTVIDVFPAPLDGPAGLAWDGEHIWLSNSDFLGGDDYIYKLDTDGTVLEQYNSPGTFPVGLAFDGRYLWCVDWSTDTVYQLDIGHVSDCPWLDENPKSGSVPPGEQDEITVSIDASGLDPGEYSANIAIGSNDPDEDPVTVPVEVHVTEDGALPDIDVSPAALEETLAEGETVVRTLNINNTGSVSLTFDIHEVNGGFTPASAKATSTGSEDTSQLGSGPLSNALSWIGVVPDPPSEFEAAPMREAAAEAPPSSTGLLQPPMDLSHLTGENLPADRMPAILPDEFDWRDRSGTNYVTPVKDQADCGSCYAFGAIGNLESKLLIDGAGTYDFSENNAKECNWRELNNFQYPNPGDYWGSCDGGNPLMIANLFSQKGTVQESCDPYQDSDVACKSTCPYRKTALGWRLINGVGTPDPAVLKQYIYDNGPVITSMYADSTEGFNSYDGSYTIDYTTPGDAINHCVLIVGWSGSLPPVSGSAVAADGWIVKNSWGTSWGDDGYFYITYGAANIGSASSFFNAWQDYDTTGDVWYYDEGGWWDSFGETGGSNTTAWGLAKFTATGDTTVTRVEFWTADETTDVDIYVYEDFDGTTLSGLRATELNNAFGEAGYHSVALDSPVAVSDGDDVVAVVKFTNASLGYPVVVDQIGPIETGRTYISLTGSDGSWTDLGAVLDSDAGIRLRTSEATGEDVLWLSEDPISGTVPAGGSQTVDVTFDATGLSAGIYTADIVIDNNDPDEDPVTVRATLHVGEGEDKIHLPLVMKRWPPIPDTPVLNPISNPDGDGNYHVSWSSAYLADTYTLQEDDNAAFSSPTTRYTGSGTSWNATGKSPGTYYYQVKAGNAWGDSGWSTTRSVIVRPPGDHYEGDSPSVSFDVEGQQVCNFDMRVPFQDGTCHVDIPTCMDIDDDEFSYTVVDPWLNTYENSITGVFKNQDRVEGHYSIHFCGSTLSFDPSEGDWEATKQ
jgi:C1A family cysteine protease